MKQLTSKYRRRLGVLWTIQAAVIAYNVRTPSFETMAAPMAVCWLYVMACVAREGFGFERAFSQRYPQAFREWKTGWSRPGLGPCPVPGDEFLRARWEEVRSVTIFSLLVFAGIVALFFALLGRMMLFGPYE